MVRHYSLSYSEFFYTFPCFFVHYSVIYHCFLLTYLFPLNTFHPFSSIYSSFPLDFPPPISPLRFPISCSSFSCSPVEVPSQEYTIFPIFFHCVFDTSSCCFHLFTVYCHYFPPFIVYMNFSFDPSCFFTIFFSLSFKPQFHPLLFPQ
jgi:hypothetical protein